MSTIHQEIAKELFLAMRAEQTHTPREAAEIAIREATVFAEVYAEWRRADIEAKRKYQRDQLIAEGNWPPSHLPKHMQDRLLAKYPLPDGKEAP